MPNGRFRLLALLLGLAFVATACGDDDDSDFLGCGVTATGGFDDNSSNENAFNGLRDAAEEIGFEPVVLESQSEADFEPNINELLDQGCDIIVAVGFRLGDATEAAAQDNPETDFAIVDFASEETYDNLLGLTYATHQAAFLAGYVAADRTESGTVGTYGDQRLPTVSIFMKGFEAGVEYYNEQKGADVKLAGWNTATDDGLFTGDVEDLSKGRQTTESLLDQGVDIILPVAGPVGQGAVEAIRAGGDDAKLIWVDTDGCESMPEACDLFLTSVRKNSDVSVYEAVTAAAEGKFEGGRYGGTLENDGVELAPFHEFEGDIPDELQAELDEIRAGIIDGSIATTLE